MKFLREKVHLKTFKMSI